MLTTPVYNLEGEEVSKVNLPEEIFGLEINPDLIYQVLNIQRSNKRTPFAHTKDRGEVRGGGRKPWRQKGTGRARHGSNRSPIWIGGGVTFGPTNDRNFERKINKKMRRKAILMTLSSKLKDKELIVFDKLELKEGKTKAMAKILDNILNKINPEDKKSFLVATVGKSENIIQASRNLNYVKTISADSLNIYDVLCFKYLVIDKQGLEMVEKTFKK